MVLRQVSHKNCHNFGHNVLRLFDVIPIFFFITGQNAWLLVINMIYKSCQEI